MPFTTKRSPLELSAEQKQELEKLRRSPTEEKRGVQHAALLLDSAAGLSDGEVARRNEVRRHTVALCSQDSSVLGWKRRWEIFRARARARLIPDDAIAWVQNCSCRKPK